MTSWTFNQIEIDEFKRSWPDHGLPDNLAELTFVMDDQNGDLVDIEATDDHGDWLDSAEFDGPALLTLSEDAKDKLGRA